MSLVPYTSRDSREIVLRHNDAVVVRDPDSNQLNLRDASSNSIHSNECPLCHQAIHSSRSPERDARAPNRRDSFVSPEYFRILRAELESDRFAPSSPIRRLVQPAFPGAPPASSAKPVSEAEFVTSTPAKAQGIRTDALSPGYYKKFFIEERELGRGGKGVVHLVRHELDGVSLGQFACKRVPVGDDHAWLEKVLIEVQLLQSLSHPNLVSYRHVWLEDFQPNRFGPSLPCAFILQQYCNAGDLLRYVAGDRPPVLSVKDQLKDQMRRRSKPSSDRPDKSSLIRGLQFDRIYSFFRDITSGLAHLHEANFIHRDLKPSNCLLHDNGTDLRCLISDFGEVQPEHVIRTSTGATGTISYCAPEVLRRNITGRYGEFTTKSDIFSLGMILYFMCFGRLPYSSADAIQEEREDLDLLREEISSWSGFKVEKLERPDLPDRLYEYLKRLLSLNPMERPSAAEILLTLNTGQGLDATPRISRSNSGDQNFGQRNGRRIQTIDTSAAGNGMAMSSSAYIEDVQEAKQSPEAFLEKHDNQLRSKDSSEDVANDDRLLSPRQHLLLPPPLTRFDTIKHELVVYRHHMAMWCSRNFYVIMFVSRIMIFAIKMASLLQLCSPIAANPLVAYPLLLLATIDVSLGNFRWQMTMSMLLLHLVVITIAVRKQALCLAPRSLWED